MSIKDTQNTIDEVHEIMILLRGGNAKADGDFRSQHLATILNYLRQQRTENKQITLSKLALMVGMAQRQIKENYFDGITNFGIISINTECNMWEWVGVKAIKGQYGKLRINTPEENEYITESLKEYVKKHPNDFDKNLINKESEK